MLFILCFVFAIAAIGSMIAWSKSGRDEGSGWFGLMMFIALFGLTFGPFVTSIASTDQSNQTAVLVNTYTLGELPTAPGAYVSVVDTDTVREYNYIYMTSEKGPQRFATLSPDDAVLKYNLEPGESPVLLQYQYQSGPNWLVPWYNYGDYTYVFSLPADGATLAQ